MTRLVRLKEILEHLPIGRSTFLAGVKSGIYPRPVKLGPNITAWRWADIEDLMENGISLDGESS